MAASPYRLTNVAHLQFGLASNLPAYEDGSVFRNVGIYNSDARKLPRRKHKIFRTRRKFEIKKTNSLAQKNSSKFANLQKLSTRKKKKIRFFNDKD